MALFAGFAAAPPDTGSGLGAVLRKYHSDQASPSLAYGIGNPSPHSAGIGRPAVTTPMG